MSRKLLRVLVFYNVAFCVSFQGLVDYEGDSDDDEESVGSSAAASANSTGSDDSNEDSMPAQKKLRTE